MLDPRDQDPTMFGPTGDDIFTYTEMLREIEANPESQDYNVRFNAECTALSIDRGQISMGVNVDVRLNGLDDKSEKKHAQQRYIAAALGLDLDSAVVEPDNWLVASNIRLPSLDNLPELPAQVNGEFVDAEGNRLSRPKADAIFAGRFIAKYSEHFSGDQAFERTFQRVVAHCETGRIEIEKGTNTEDTRGRMSLTRQIARVLGYRVGDYRLDKSLGKFVMDVDGIKPGFDPRNSYFKEKGIVVDPIERGRVLDAWSDYVKKTGDHTSLDKWKAREKASI